jgi:DNA primase
MPEGLDPDELILQDRERWDALLASSQPVVRFYFQHMLAQGDPGEPKMKSRIVDAMLPLLSDIGDSIERESYVQEIAQTLALEPRMLLDRLRARERAEAIHSEAALRRADTARPETAQPIDDLEAHLLTVFLNYPEVLRSLNAHLQQRDPDGEIWKPITASDFDSDGRLIWSAMNQVRRQPEYQLEDFLPSDMLERVEQWKAVQMPERGLDQWERDATRTLLRMRERHLRSRKSKMDTVLMEAQAEGDLEGMLQALQAIQKLAKSLKQIQTALARRPVKA